MNIRFEKWKNWDTVKCTAGQNELIVGISAGPRILSFSHNGGENQLYEDTTNFGVGEWRMFGGHRFTVAPEDENSYYSDNKPCECRVEGAMLHVSAKQRSDGLILSLLIRASQPGGFWIDHVLLNNGTISWAGALWAITCVPRSNKVTGSCTTDVINFWPDTDASMWKRTNDRMTVKEGNFRGKAGWFSAAPEFTAISPAGRLIISSPDKSVREFCVDNGSNVELFVCPWWVEMETLSEKYVVVPGSSVSHRQHWQLQPICKI